MFENHSKVLLLTQNFRQAVTSKDVKKAKELLDNHPEIDIDGEIISTTPILFAAQNEDWEMFEMLFLKNANLDVHTHPNNWFLIHECVENAPKNLAEAVIDYANINSPTVKNKTPLMVAIEKGRLDIANYMINSERLELNIADINGNNALHYAAIYDQNNLFVKILEKSYILGEKKNSLLKKNKGGYTPVDLIKDEIFKITFKINVPVKKVELEELKKLGSLKVKNLEFKIEDNLVGTPKIQGLSSIKRKM